MRFALSGYIKFEVLYRCFWGRKKLLTGRAFFDIVRLNKRRMILLSGVLPYLTTYGPKTRHKKGNDSLRHQSLQIIYRHVGYVCQMTKIIMSILNSFGLYFTIPETPQTTKWMG